MAYNQTADAAAQAAAQNTAQTGTTTTPPGGSGAPDMSWDWTTDGLTLPVTLVSTSDAVAKLEAALLEIARPIEGHTLKLLSVDNAVETGWRYSCAVLALHRASTNWLSYCPLLLEATEGKPLEGRAVRIANTDRSVTVIPVPSDALDEAYIARIGQLLGGVFPNAQALLVQGMVIPKTVSFDETQTLKHILMVATRSCVTQLAEIDPRFIDNNLSKLRRDGQAATTIARLTVTNGGPSGDIRDVLGEPVRQDVKLTLVSVTPKATVDGQSQIAQAHSLNGNGQAEDRIGMVPAYLDVRMLPGVQTLYTTDPMTRTRRFVPELVITGAELSKLATTAGLMMMITQMTNLAEPRIWHSILYQRTMAGRSEYSQSPFDPTDIGVLNLISNVGAEQVAGLYDTKSSNVGPAEFIDYVLKVFTQQLAISIDVPRLGPQASYTAVLTACARGSKTALAFLQNSLDKLTGNLFSRKFFAATGGVGELKTSDVFSEWGNSIYTGNYTQKVGDTTRDIDLRHIDTVALLARFGKSNPEIVTKWAQSFMVNHIDAAIRMANKRDVIDSYTNNSANITGISERHTFNTPFLRAVVECNMANGFTPVLEFRDPLAGADTGLQAPGFMNTGLFSTGVQGAYTAGGMNNQNQVGGGYINTTASRF